MRDEIKKVATKLVTRHGYRGFQFRGIAERLNTTRANIHYYFGSKQRLVDEVVCDYVRITLDQLEKIWQDDALSLKDKIDCMMELNRERYLRYNPSGKTGYRWSLLAQARLDRELVGEDARQITTEFGLRLDRLVRKGIEDAVSRGELAPETPVGDVALQLVAIANTADPITQDSGSFKRLEHLYRAFARLLFHAYAPDRSNAHPASSGKRVIYARR